MLRWLNRKRVRGEDLNDELQYHLEMLARECLERGEAPDAAGAAARRAIGNQTQIRESLYEIWNWNWFESVLADCRYALRVLGRSKDSSPVC